MKFLSLLLRHKPQILNLNMDSSGWVSIDELLSKMNSNEHPITMEELDAIVRDNSKKRFEFNEDKSKIRATQGHSFDINLQLKPQQPPDVLYHGTATRFLDSILENGLNKQKRHHVHLTTDLKTASQVGSRYGKLVLLEIDASAMYKDGIEFYCTKNNVWLTDKVHPKYSKVLK